MNDCSLNKNFNDLKIVLGADLIIMGSEFSESRCINDLIKKTNLSGKKIFFVGPKHFGNNLNWVIRKDKNERHLLRNNIPKYILNHENDFKSIVPEENYISYIDKLSSENRILITDKNGNLISDDRQHLTLSGARYVGEKVFLSNYSISNYFTKK